MSDRDRKTVEAALAGLGDEDEFEEAPTQKIQTVDVKTDPTRVGVIGADAAAEFRAEHEETVLEEQKLTFVGTVDEKGRIVIGEHILRGRGALKPGDELIIRAEKIG